MNHLGERVTALVDGQLSIDSADRALVHVAGCDHCREAVETERLMKHRLAMLDAPVPGGPLLSALIGLSGPDGPMPPRPGHVPGSPRPELVAGLAAVGSGGPLSGSGHLYRSAPSAWYGEPDEPPRTVLGRPPTRRDASRPPLGRTERSDALQGVGRLVGRSRNRMAVAVVGAACLVGAGVAGGVANGRPVGARVVPPVDAYVLDQAATTGTLPYGDETVMWGTVGARR